MRLAAALPLAAIAIVVTAPAVAGPSRGVADPQAAVRAAYATESQGKDGAALMPMTPRLAAALRRPADGPGEPDARTVGFSWLINAQEADIAALRVDKQIVARRTGEPPRMIVRARFTNGGAAQTIVTYWEKAADGWRLDDASNSAWTLSLLYRYGEPAD